MIIASSSPSSLMCLSSFCCCCLVAKSSLTLCDLMDWAHQTSLFFIISWSLLKFMSIESVMLSNHVILCCPLLLLPSTFPSIRVFSNELALHIRCPKYWSINFSPSNEYSYSYISALLSSPTRLKAPWRQKQCLLYPSALLPNSVPHCRNNQH